MSSEETVGRRPILIIDVANMFIRAWAAYPQMSAKGYQMGGTIGFLKMLRKLVNDIQPETICLAWEGGGSTKRRQIYSDYKMGRRPEKLNRFYGEDIPDTEENRKHQLLTLIKLAKYVPACQIYVSDCEGDDIIAYLCRVKFPDRNKVIASSDKDMLQLLDQQTQVYSFHKKRCLTEQDVLEEFRVTAQNFAIAKAVCGDPSDNIPGVGGIGFKTIAKLLPTLGTSRAHLLQEIFDFSHSHVEESKLYQKIIDAKDDIKRNWRLVYLDGGMLSPTQMTRVDQLIDAYEPMISKIPMIKVLTSEGIGDFDVDWFFYPFHCIVGLKNG